VISERPCRLAVSCFISAFPSLPGPHPKGRLYPSRPSIKDSLPCWCSILCQQQWREPGSLVHLPPGGRLVGARQLDVLAPGLRVAAPPAAEHARSGVPGLAPGWQLFREQLSVEGGAASSTRPHSWLPLSCGLAHTHMLIQAVSTVSGPPAPIFITRQKADGLVEGPITVDPSTVSLLAPVFRHTSNTLSARACTQAPCPAGCQGLTRFPGRQPGSSGAFRLHLAYPTALCPLQARPLRVGQLVTNLLSVLG